MSATLPYIELNYFYFYQNIFQRSFRSIRSPVRPQVGFFNRKQSTKHKVVQNISEIIIIITINIFSHSSFQDHLLVHQQVQTLLMVIFSKEILRDSARLLKISVLLTLSSVNNNTPPSSLTSGEVNNRREIL